MASLGHSGSQAPQLMQSDVIWVAMGGLREGRKGAAQSQTHVLGCAALSFTALLLQLRYRLWLAVRWASGSPALVRAVLMASAVALVGCAPKIGDHCLVS